MGVAQSRAKVESEFEIDSPVAAEPIVTSAPITPTEIPQPAETSDLGMQSSSEPATTRKAQGLPNEPTVLTQNQGLRPRILDGDCGVRRVRSRDSMTLRDSASSFVIQHLVVDATLRMAGDLRPTNAA
jgi:hypothetical protein